MRPEERDWYLGLEGRLEELAEVGWDRLRLLLLVVVRDEDALRPCEHPTAAFLQDLVAQCEGRRPDLRRPDADADLVAPEGLRLEIDVDVREDEVDLVERLPVRELHVELRPGEFHVRQVDGVVHVAHPVDVPESHLDVRREARHPPADATLRRKTFGCASPGPDQAGEFVGWLEDHLLRRVAADDPHRGKTRLREIPVDRPRPVDPTSQGRVDRANRLRRHSHDELACGELGGLADDRTARAEGTGSDDGPPLVPGFTATGAKSA